MSRPWWTSTWSYVGVVQTCGCPLNNKTITTNGFYSRKAHFVSESRTRTTSTQIYEFSAAIPYSLRNPTRKVTSIKLPSADSGLPARLHIFAISLLPASTADNLTIRSARLGAPLPASSTAQEPRPLFIVLASLYPPSNTLHQNVRISVCAPGWSSSKEIWVNRVRSGDEARLRIEVEPFKGSPPSTLRFQIDDQGAQTKFLDVPLDSELSEHDLPQWVCGLSPWMHMP
jgi:hypothetical protein